jgi:CMP-N,N'-diacetyllegionaminic acid synthase
MTTSIVALIPARSGSKRIPDKNIRLLGGKPLLQRAIETAIESEAFREIIVCSDSEEYLRLAESWGADVFLREPSPDTEPDIVWVRRVLQFQAVDAFALLRPSNPFRSVGMIQRGIGHFLLNQPADSLRAVEVVRQHPGKMWLVRQNRMLPLLPWENTCSPWHSSPTQTLPRVYTQNASLEIAWRRTVTEQGTIAGTAVIPFECIGIEGYDLNTMEDWERAERIMERGGPECR